MKNLMVSGTDTEVGKTVLTTAIAAYWQKYRKPESLGLIKLIQTGVGDIELYDRLLSVEAKSPLVFQTPVAPPVAAAKEGRTIELAKVWQGLNDLQQRKDFVLIEALGGLGSPVTGELTVADLAAQWRLNVVLVVPVRLGAIAATVANVALASQTKVHLKGIILNCTQPETEAKLNDLTPIELIESLTNLPVLGIFPYLADPTDLEKLTQIASNLTLIDCL
ncbi:MAG: dethiobiotin synthase [Oscillatoria sp. PMC 1051.18]|uniref:dethiobiotin synthase n=1 Tax=Oscillatoria salina TaxID=331517 RepID=UPI0013B7EBCB|nr:dethiobiotin synthase [Oscillatoria salina]MBZ8180350.1 ATP-dependent dethiobiotin synthetase BioD [Oscillatoria salina IIICB1]MEC4892344.1 dethiobiotin synthase [Oscillatoria sp. PMC 1050.18]MEC5029099.1 dethiobiotin synthase [Oscillatoria sp. PMC 1051.18]NET87948.1 ATP-dependent dethiobiotin synthetase BioD [Kamptonema sp. SIO1D9]